jgi:tetratricopeptide (TPR) repeat protein
MLDAIHEHFCRERHKAARAAILALPDDPATHVERRLLHAHMALADGAEPVDEVILELVAQLEGTLRPTEDQVARAYELLISAYARKRLPGLARSMLAAGRARLGERPGFLSREADVHLLEDDRTAARVCLEKALALAPDDTRARFGLGNLYYLLGDFATAEAELERVPAGSLHFGISRRVRAASQGSRGDHATEATTWRELLAGLPDGDRVASDRLTLGMCLVNLGDRAGAIAELRAAWQAAPDQGVGRYARARMTTLESARPDAPRKNLTAFPTVAQKWNYCGPAVLELVLRYFDYAADQDAIASLVKREHGTPMYAIVSHLAHVGVEARRVALTAEKIRRAIDLGCPVIVQEEYSTSSHVAVITGYDESLGVFVSQDPATHRPTLKAFTFTQAAGDLFGNGGVVVMGPAPVSDDRRAACDAAGLTDARYLHLVDQASRRRRKLSGTDEEPLSPAEEIALCDEALREAPDYKLARYLRARATHTLAQIAGGSRDDAWTQVTLARVRYPADEWPHQLHGALLREANRQDEAFVAYLEAHRRDPQDGDNLQLMGEARWLAGDLPAAEKYMLKAIEENSDLVRAAENLAAVYLRQLEEPDEGDDDDGDDEPSASASTMPPERLRVPLARPRDEVFRRARHFSRVAIAGHPGNPFNHVVAGTLATLGERHADAGAAYQ